MSRKEDRDLVLGNLVSALHMIEKSRDFALIIPEIRASLAYAPSWAKSAKDVAAIEGRIAPVNGYPRAAGLPAFGASLRTAATILAFREYDPDVNAAIIVKCNEEIIKLLREYAYEKGFIFGMIDRQLEPPSEKYRKMGGGWRFRHMADTVGGAPRVFYENKGMGLEQLSILLGKDAVEVTEMALDIAKRYRQKRGK